jgi:uncharacterized coiled-coil DUF342 family protein
MNDQNNLVPDHLRAIRADINELKGSNRDIRARLASIESYIATMHGDQTRSAMNVDELRERVERIETRLGLSGA